MMTTRGLFVQLVLGGALSRPARSISYPPSTLNSLSAILVYTGRWLGRDGHENAANHIRNLIVPLQERGLRVRIILATTESQWCSTNSSLGAEALLAEMSSAFPGYEVAARVDPDPEQLIGADEVLHAMTLAAGSKASEEVSDFKQRMMESFVAQTTHLLRANELRRERGWKADLLVRTRIDVRYASRVVLPAELELAAEHSRPAAPQPQLAPARADDAECVYAERGKGTGLHDDGLFEPRYKDFTLIFLATRCLDALTSVVTAQPLKLLHNDTVRCFGFCTEEQIQMVLEQSGCRFADLPNGGANRSDTWSEIDQSLRSQCTNGVEL
jgi:hypothetical protein